MRISEASTEKPNGMSWGVNRQHGPFALASCNSMCRQCLETNADVGAALEGDWARIFLCQNNFGICSLFVFSLFSMRSFFLANRRRIGVLSSFLFGWSGWIVVLGIPPLSKKLRTATRYVCFILLHTKALDCLVGRWNQSDSLCFMKISE